VLCISIKSAVFLHFLQQISFLKMANLFNPHVTVACIAWHQNRFLMVEEQINGKLVINQPAGHLEAGESLTDALIRETLEESAYLVKPISIVGIYLYKAHQNLTFLRICFYAQILEQQNRALDSGISQVLWLSLDEISRAKNLRSEMVLTCVNDFMAGNNYPLEVLRPLIGYQI